MRPMLKRMLLAQLCVLGAACSDPVSSTTTTWDTTPPFVGFSLSPPSVSEQGFKEFFETAVLGADLLAWSGPWQDLSAGGGFIVEQAAVSGYVPVVITGFPTVDGRRVLPDDLDEVVEAVTDWVADNQVPYLGLGVEINAFLWEKAPEDFERLAHIYPDLVASVHSVSEGTRVFPVFQLERLRGLKSGLFGETDTAPEWELIARFPDADVIGFTTYPGLIYTDPGQVPDDYYRQILEHVDRPIVFTEVGWQAGGELGEWSGSADKQADFVTRWVPELTEIADMVIWSFLWDQGQAAPFETMGLIGEDGERPAWQAWLDLFG
ncbi:MAG: hypothetical protein L0Z47_10050 [Actinobacteria bacterium]|nr:hypothetical protein [Actinomycetota bacterium]